VIDFAVNNSDIIFLQTNTGFVFSSDYGSTWNTSNLNSFSNLSCLSIDPNGFLFIGGLDGIQKSKISTLTGIQKLSAEIPIVYSLAQNYPNPFNPMTTISFSLPSKSFVSLKVFDVIGREVAMLMSQEKPAGTYNVTFDASKLPSGVYFYRLTIGDFTQVKKMLLVK
jgi:hypothetical protein